MPSFHRHLLLTTCTLGLVWSATIGRPNPAGAADDPIRSAEQACLQNATSNGYKAEAGKASAPDGDNVDVPLELSREGSPATKVTCRYSVKSGLASLTGTVKASSRKASPFAAAKDETADGEHASQAAPVAGGTQAPGSKKASPYAAAKDEMQLSFGPALGRLWLLLVPVGLAAGSYAYLRKREDGDLAA
jgi:hypothetical protein